jgi:hypothetical protein
MRFEVSTLSGAPILHRPQRTMALTIVKAKKQKRGVLYKTRTPRASPRQPPPPRPSAFGRHRLQPLRRPRLLGRGQLLSPRPLVGFGRRRGLRLHGWLRERRVQLCAFWPCADCAGAPSSATWLATGLVSSEGSLDVIDDIERSQLAFGNRRNGSGKGRP